MNFVMQTSTSIPQTANRLFFFRNPKSAKFICAIVVSLECQNKFYYLVCNIVFVALYKLQFKII